MILRSFAFLLALSSAVPVAAQCVGQNLIEAMPPERRAELDAAVAAAPYPEGNLWKAEKDGKTVYVQGTIHIPDSRLAAIADRVRPLVEGADVLVLEATKAQQADLQKMMAEKPDLAFITEGPTLIDLLSNEEWSKLSAELEARGVPSVLGAKMRPWLVGMTVSIPECALAAIAAGKEGLDAQLEEMANADHVDIGTLDDMKTLLDYMTEGTIEEQLDMLRITLATDQDQDAAMATTLDSYFAGRHRELWEFSKVMAEESGIDPAAFAKFEATLLDGRNTAWAERLPSLIDGKNAVIAVGAAHLSGETGILNTLHKLGYTLTPL